MQRAVAVAAQQENPKQKGEIVGLYLQSREALSGVSVDEAVISHDTGFRKTTDSSGLLIMLRQTAWPASSRASHAPCHILVKDLDTLKLKAGDRLRAGYVLFRVFDPDRLGSYGEDLRRELRHSGGILLEPLDSLGAVMRRGVEMRVV